MPDKGSDQSRGPEPGLQRAPRRSEHTNKWTAHFQPPRSLLCCPCPIQRPNLFTEHQRRGSSRVRPGAQISQHSPPPNVPRLQPTWPAWLLLPLRPLQRPLSPWGQGSKPAAIHIKCRERFLTHRTGPPIPTLSTHAHAPHKTFTLGARQPLRSHRYRHLVGSFLLFPHHREGTPSSLHSGAGSPPGPTQSCSGQTPGSSGI